MKREVPHCRKRIVCSQCIQGGRLVDMLVLYCILCTVCSLERLGGGPVSYPYFIIQYCIIQVQVYTEQYIYKFIEKVSKFNPNNDAKNTHTRRH